MCLTSCACCSGHAFEMFVSSVLWPPPALLLHPMTLAAFPAAPCPPSPQTDAKAERAGAKAAKRVGRAKSGREEREEAAKKSAIEELKAARERKARGAEERWVCQCCCRCWAPAPHTAATVSFQW